MHWIESLKQHLPPILELLGPKSRPSASAGFESASFQFCERHAIPMYRLCLEALFWPPTENLSILLLVNENSWDLTLPLIWLTLTGKLIPVKQAWRNFLQKKLMVSSCWLFFTKKSPYRSLTRSWIHLCNICTELTTLPKLTINIVGITLFCPKYKRGRLIFCFLRGISQQG